MKLVPSSISDREAVFHLYEKLFRVHVEEIWGWDDEWQIKNFRTEWEVYDTSLVFQDHELIGYVQTRTEPDHIFILNIGLLPKYQSRGVGTEIVKSVKHTARDQNLAIKLNVHRTNQQVVPFYERLGFRIEEKTNSGFFMHWQKKAHCD